MGKSEQGIHSICDRFVDDFAAADPINATMLGVAGFDDQLTDYSPEGYAARAAIARRALSDITAAEPADESERLARAVFTERIGAELAVHDAGLDLATLNVMENPVDSVRMAFDLMPTDTPEQWANISARLAAVPRTLDGARTALLAAADNGRVSALRQVAKVAEQAETLAGLSGPDGYFQTLIGGAAEMPESLRADLARGVQVTEEACAELAGFLRAELAPRAPAKDAVGEQDYRLWSRYFTGVELDLHEAYEWGWGEFSRIESEMFEVAGRIAPGKSLAETAAVLDEDPRYRLTDRESLKRWMQELSDDAVKSLRGKHFDISDAMTGLECRIAPAGGVVGAYYTPPSQDFSRPGRMWWSLPEDRSDFFTWREVSTVYHEGVPGHHLQLATSVYQSATLNKFQRLLAFTSAHAEGWALYAERLMQDLGYLADDGDLLGMLEGQLFRAARVVVDLGMHLELEIPKGTGFHEGERWTPELGLEFMLNRTITDPAQVRSEIDRYLGWPGQAPGYKLGERFWLTARDEMRKRKGSDFDIKDFHDRALRLGGMGLDTLVQQVARFD